MDKLKTEQRNTLLQNEKKFILSLNHTEKRLERLTVPFATLTVSLFPQYIANETFKKIFD